MLVFMQIMMMSVNTNVPKVIKENAAIVCVRKKNVCRIRRGIRKALLVVLVSYLRNAINLINQA